MSLHGSSHEAHCLRFAPKTLTPHRAMSYTLPHLMTPRTGTPSSPFPGSVSQAAEQPCEDRRPQQCGPLTEPTHITVEPSCDWCLVPHRRVRRSGQCGGLHQLRVDLLCLVVCQEKLSSIKITCVVDGSQLHVVKTIRAWLCLPAHPLRVFTSTVVVKHPSNCRQHHSTH